jgi:hypothetical protein
VKIQETIGLGPAAPEEATPEKSIPDQGNVKRVEGKEMSGDNKLLPRDRVAIYVCKLYTKCFLIGLIALADAISHFCSS